MTKMAFKLLTLPYHFIDMACKRAASLVSKQHEDPKKDPFTNIHVLVKRFQTLKEEQNYFGKNRRYNEN